MKIEELLKKFEKSKDEHNKFVNLYNEVYKYGMPERYGNITRTEKGVKATDEVFTSVFEEACDGFVQKIQSLLTPVHTDWINFELGAMFEQEGIDEQQKQDAKRTINQIAKMINVFKDNSNFDRAMTQFFYELIAGTATMLVMPGDVNKPLKFISIPFKEIFMVEGTYGEIDTFFRSLTIKNRLVKQQWKDATYTYEPTAEDEERTFIESTYYDYEKNNWVYAVIAEKEKNIIYEKRSDTCPFIEFRWGKITGETYGRGQGLKVIADCKTLNQIKYNSLLSLSFAFPVYTVRSEDIDVENFVMSPGALNPTRENRKDNPPVSALPVNQAPDLAQYNMNQLEMNIKRGMFASTIPNDPDRKTTATEIAERVSELDTAASNAYGASIEFIYRLVQRIADVLSGFGWVDKTFVKMLDGFNYKVRVNSALTNQQSAKEVQTTLQALQFMQTLDPTMQYTQKILNLEKLAPYILEKLGINPEFIRTTEEIQMLEQQTAEAMAMQQQQAMADDVAVANAKEQGKANAQSQMEG